ncbi:hypothetical protein PV336_16165 [Streptomyces sp. MI02-2A]|uniref:hypothetical protein n=1 Tax=Streptomyces sp. MI02-2A TaxID=3028688 RepID=UPI0029A10D3A|nr:hypothetical protein [Streptomyces sp. MI02-2A]MDX3260756.1 hypothetical protein [Streptomyces sp. MI02-2A]
MELYFGGSEIPGWRKMLAEEGVETVSLSYMGLRRRTKFSRPWLIEDHYLENQKVFLDSGAYTVNKADEEKYTLGALKDIAAHYEAFVLQNIDALNMVSEFDALVLGREWIEARREDFWEDLPEDKFLPIWHSEWGVDELDRLAQRYKRVGVTQTDLDGRNLTPVLNEITRKYGTLLHGVAMTKPAEMSAVNWSSVASTSWLSPSQYGDTIVWTGRELKRYPKKYKDQARKRHRTLFVEAGFDPDKIENGDNDEVLRMTIWSWQQLAASIASHTNETVTTSGSGVLSSFAQMEGAEVDTATGEVLNEVATPVVRRDRPRTNLPVIGLVQEKETYTDPEDGVNKERDVPLVTVRSQSMRVCSTCFLAQKCPAYDKEANCAYDIPVQIKTKPQMQALQNSLIEMQTQRVFFMRMAEDMTGGYADPNLSGEIDRLQKLIKVKTELEQEGFSVKLEAKGNGAQAGMISRIFGKDAGEQVTALERPIPADRMIEQGTGFIDAEIVDVPTFDVQEGS